MFTDDGGGGRGGGGNFRGGGRGGGGRGGFNRFAEQGPPEEVYLVFIQSYIYYSFFVQYFIILLYIIFTC